MVDGGALAEETVVIAPSHVCGGRPGGPRDAIVRRPQPVKRPFGLIENASVECAVRIASLHHIPIDSAAVVVPLTSNVNNSPGEQCSEKNKWIHLNFIAAAVGIPLSTTFTFKYNVYNSVM